MHSETFYRPYAIHCYSSPDLKLDENMLEVTSIKFRTHFEPITFISGYVLQTLFDEILKINTDFNYDQLLHRRMIVNRSRMRIKESNSGKKTNLFDSYRWFYQFCIYKPTIVLPEHTIIPGSLQVKTILWMFGFSNIWQI